MIIQLELINTPQTDPSLSKRVPKGWRADDFTTSDGQKFRRAIDPDGCRWYWTEYDSQKLTGWKLNVCGFRSSKRGLDRDDIACLDHESGVDLDCKITNAGTVLIGNRKVSRRNWNH